MEDTTAPPAVASERCCIATLLTSDGFSMAAEALLSSLQRLGGRTAAAEVLLLHTAEVSRTTIAKLRSKCSKLVPRKVDPIATPHDTKVEAWVNSGFTKLRLWEQDDFQKIVYIDADCLVLENIDELFDRPSPSFAPDVFPPDKFNAGVIVLEPNKAVFEDMLSKIGTLPSHDGGDTGFLNSYFSDWFRWSAEHRLPFRYNALRTMYWFTHTTPGYWEAIKPIKILHFCSSPKPWDPEAKKGDLEQLWWEHYVKSQIQMPF